MPLHVSPAGEPDVPALVRLMDDLDVHYGLSRVESRAERERQTADALFGDPPAVRALLARDGDGDTEPVGLATYAVHWPAIGTTTSLYVKELYVRRGHRGRGVGRLLLDHVTATARARGCSRVEWTTARTNGEAQHYYAALGVPTVDKVFYRLLLPPS